MEKAELEERLGPPSKPGESGWLRILPGLVISAVSLAVVLYFADPQRLMDALRLADYRLVALGILITLVWLAIRGVVWRTLLREKAAYRDVFMAVNEGYLINNLLPFRLGEVGRSYLLSRKSSPLDFWQVLSTIVIERALDLLLAVGLLMATLPSVVGAGWARQAAYGAGAVVGVGLVTLYLLARWRKGAAAVFETLGSRWPVLNRLGGRAVPAFLSGLEVLTDGARFLRVLVWMSLNWGVAVLQYMVYIAAFFSGSKLLWAAFSLGVTALGIAAPSSPGAVGVLELSLVGALSLFELDASVALAFAFSLHFFQYLVTGLIGVYALSREGESILDLYHRVRRIRTDRES
jgi:uncharacterized protein (TIRG00374 family)